MGMTKSRVAMMIAAMLPLAGCGALSGSKPPPFLLTLDAAAVPPAGAMRSSAEAKRLTVQVPQSPQKLRTPRILVQQADGAIAYVVGGQWVEAPARLFHRLLADTIAAKTSRLVIDEGLTSGGSGEQLAGQLLEFGIDARTNEALVVYQAMVIADAGRTIRQQRFAARRRVTTIDGRSSGEALTRAANQVAADVAAWVGD
jgi:cholesterol transport system auxiliary component